MRSNGFPELLAAGEKNRDLAAALNGARTVHEVVALGAAHGYSFGEDDVKKAPSNGRLATCTFHLEDSSEDGVFVLDGTVRISYTGTP